MQVSEADLWSPHINPYTPSYALSLAPHTALEMGKLAFSALISSLPDSFHIPPHQHILWQGFTSCTDNDYLPLPFLYLSKIAGY